MTYKNDTNEEEKKKENVTLCCQLSMDRKIKFNYNSEIRVHREIHIQLLKLFYNCTGRKWS